MKRIRFASWIIAILSALTFGSGVALAQGHEGKQPPKKPESGAAAKSDQRIGDPYPLDTCPVTGKKLGAAGDPIIKIYDGREVRFCSSSCPEQFEKDKAGNFAKIDEKIVKDQGPLYPIKTSLVTGAALPDKPFEFVYGNRLIRLGAESEKAEFMKDSAKHLGALNKAVIEQQGSKYPLSKCPVSKEDFGGEMGKPVDLVVAGRLIRLCCKDCKKTIEKDPAKYVALVDAAFHEQKPGDEHKSGGEKKEKGKEKESHEKEHH